eukprot:TRINITY_DN15378_c1_g1_i1.p1 TRINITY_DN15378_c1_g1~~TRINITY_DN15378_c1_g1_i1.p1  ORF type:complete len:155 (+),score=7.26 TRINITY_DN15378_c1_g1_i1:166-630(+)
MFALKRVFLHLVSLLSSSFDCQSKKYHKIFPFILITDCCRKKLHACVSGEKASHSPLSNSPSVISTLFFKKKQNKMCLFLSFFFEVHFFFSLFYSSPFFNRSVLVFFPSLSFPSIVVTRILKKEKKRRKKKTKREKLEGTATASTYVVMEGFLR